MIEKVRDSIYRIKFEGEEFEFEEKGIVDSKHMWIIGSDEPAKEIHVEFMKSKDMTEDEYYSKLFDALKKIMQTRELSNVFGKNVLTMVFFINKRIKIHFYITNIRAELKANWDNDEDTDMRVAETVSYMDGKDIWNELDRLFLKLSENYNEIWVCSDFDEDT